MRRNSFNHVALKTFLGLVIAGCGRSEPATPEVPLAKTAALTDAQVRAARQAGLAPSGFLPLELFDPIANVPLDPLPATGAYKINNAGTFAAHAQNFIPEVPWSFNGSGFFVDPSGQQHLLPNPSGATANLVDINQTGEMLGWGGDPNGNFQRPVIYRPDGSFQVLRLPTPYFSGGVTVPVMAKTINNVIGSDGLPAMAGHGGMYGGALGVWHFDNDTSDAVGPSSFPTPPNPQWIQGHTSIALQLNGDTCMSAPTGNDTLPYNGPGVTVMAWVKPDASMCPGGRRTIIARRYEYQMTLGCDGNGGANLAGQVIAGTSTVMPPVGSLPLGEWSHVALTSDLHTIRAFVNGALVGEQTEGTISIGAWSDTIAVGCDPSVPNSQFIGGLDEVSAFDVPMGADQIGQYLRGVAGYRASAVQYQWAVYKDGFLQIVLGPSDPAYTGSGFVSDMNDRGRIAGYEMLAAGDQSAMLYDPDSGWTNLNDLVPPDSGWNLRTADALNNAGQVTGSGVHNGRRSAFRLDLESGEIVDLGHKAEYPYNVQDLPVLVSDMNSRGDVVGAVYDQWPFWPLRACLFTNELGFTDLNSLIDPSLGWTLVEARGINDNGEIVGLASTNEDLATDRKWRAFRLKVTFPQTVAEESANSVVPRVEGIATDSAGQVKAIFRYHNASSRNTNVPYGPLNGLSGPTGFIQTPTESPPEWFAPGDSGKPFVASLTGSFLTWTVGGSSATATPSSTALPIVTSSNGVPSAQLPDGTLVPIGSDTADALADAVADTTASAGPGIAVGKTDGTFDVTEDGAASYKIPLWVPDGRNGVAPRLALSYSSRGGDGSVGVGWHMEGFSTITRCKADRTRDGAPRAIRFTNDDRLCLDGQRLVLVSGTYNQTDSEYRTEKDEFAKIVQVGADANGPTGFIVYLRDGRRRTYGNDDAVGSGALIEGFLATVSAPRGDQSDATVNYDTPVRFGWAVASERDRFENIVRYHYSSNVAEAFSGSGQRTESAIDFKPDRIDYTYSLTSGGGTPTGADRQIVLVYQPRADVRDTYVAGLHLQERRLLSHIEVHGPNPVSSGLLRDYQLGYQNDADTRTLLTSFKECDANGICQSPTTFDWTAPDSTFRKQDTGVRSARYVADIDGDGRDDLIAEDPATFMWNYWRAPKDGSGAYTAPVQFAQASLIDNTDLGAWERNSARFVDMDMDGHADMFFPNLYRYQRLKGGGFTTEFDPGEFDIASQSNDRFARNFTGDFNGDGLPDELIVDDTGGAVGQWKFRLNAGGGHFGAYDFFRWPTATSTVAARLSNNTYVVDLDGDGKAEVFFNNPSEGDPGPRLSAMDDIGVTTDGDAGVGHVRGIALMSSNRTGLRSDGLVGSYQFADINGDGLSDAIEIPPLGGDIRVAINNGRDFLPPVSITLPDNAKVGPVMDGLDHFWDNGVRVMDWDGDGRADLLITTACTTTVGPLTVLVSRSGTTLSPRALPYPADGVNGVTLTNCADTMPAITANIHVLDVNGDGLPDFARAPVEDLHPGANFVNTFAYVHNGVKPNMLRHIRDGLGHTVDVTYKPISDESVHTRALPDVEPDGGPAPLCTYPQYCTPRGSNWVVSQHQLDANDFAHQLTYRHNYVGARTDITGPGWLGFYSHTVTDLRTGIETQHVFGHYHEKLGANIYPLTGKASSEIVTVPLATGRTITETSSTDYTVAIKDSGARVAVSPHVTTFTETETDPDDGGITVKRASTDTTVYDDNYGYLRTRLVQIEGEAEGTVLTYDPDRPDVWLIGMVSRRTTAYTTPARSFGTVSTPSETTVRTIGYINDATTGAVTDIITEPDSVDNDIYLRRTITRNAFGQVTATTDTQRDGTARQSRIEYGSANGIFPSATINALGQRSQVVFHPGLGLLARSTDPNGLVTSRRYDRLGWMFEEHHPDGSVLSVARTGFDDDGPLAISRTDRGLRITSVYDERGHEFETRFAGAQAETSYDAYGRIKDRWRSHGLPLPDGATLDTLPHTHFEYDALGRPTLEALAPSQKQWTYIGNTATRSTSTETGVVSDDTLVDMRGRLIHRTERVTDNTGFHQIPTHYFYGPFGQLRDVLDGKGNVTHVDHDVLGRRTALTDPDSGTTKERYDAFDLLRARTNANSQTTLLSYDLLGRIQSETTTDGTSVSIWDTAPNGIGLPAATIGQDEVVTTYTYNSRGQRDSETWQIEDNSFRLDYAFDDLGRPSTIQYPQVGSSRYEATRHYSGTGELDSVTDPAGSVLWRVTSRNPERKITGETFGDGASTTRGYEPERGMLTSIQTLLGSDQLQALTYHYDRRGFMDTRANYLDGEAEHFTHDELGRLVDWSGGSDWEVRYAYDDIGNMLSRTHLVSRIVEELKTFTPVGPSRPHAVGTVTTNGTTAAYGYDDAGRQTSGPDRTIAYTDFDLPRTIAKPDGSWTFKYTGYHHRALKRGPSGTTLYVGDLVERRISGGTTTDVMYVPGERGPVAQVTQVGGATPEVTYLHDDHAGSIDVAGSTKMKFDPFGARVGTEAPPENASSNPAPAITLGFAGQQEDDGLGLVNMGGRIYDPALARFLTPDPHVTRPWRSQSLNRYAYVENSPLAMNDPTGLDDISDEEDAKGGSGEMCSTCDFDDDIIEGDAPQPPDVPTDGPSSETDTTACFDPPNDTGAPPDDGKGDEDQDTGSAPEHGGGGEPPERENPDEPPVKEAADVTAHVTAEVTEQVPITVEPPFRYINGKDVFKPFKTTMQHLDETPPLKQVVLEGGWKGAGKLESLAETGTGVHQAVTTAINAKNMLDLNKALNKGDSSEALLKALEVATGLSAAEMLAMGGSARVAGGYGLLASGVAILFAHAVMAAAHSSGVYSNPTMDGM